MKHSHKVTALLIAIFLLSQIVGLFIINNYIDHKALTQTGVVSWDALPFDMERPPVENETTSFIPIAIALLIGTALVLVLIRYNLVLVLKAWFFLVVVLTLTFAFGSVIPDVYAIGLAFIIAAWKMFRPNIYVHNISELFIYGGLAAIFVPMLNVIAAFALLLFISLYDIWAVWHSKHMVHMAKFQSDAKMFAGLFIPYGTSKEHKHLSKKQSVGHVEKTVQSRVAVLGGGDMGFPLIFAGVVMKSAMLLYTEPIAFLKILPIPLCAAAALAILLIKSEKGKFYPAMPFISVGCLIGYGVYLLL